jgi:hypothetical protein
LHLFFLRAKACKFEIRAYRGQSGSNPIFG